MIETRYVARLALLAGAAMTLSACGTLNRMNPMRYVAQPGCQNATNTFYFDVGSDQLTAPAKVIIRETAASMKACRVREVHLVGLADPTGSPEANLVLSRRRAQTVLEAYQAAGLGVNRYHIQAGGDLGATTGDGTVEPLRRQVVATLVVGRKEPT
ncbi:MAG: OmpA family protein [Caulobacteraceae bacterium]